MPSILAFKIINSKTGLIVNQYKRYLLFATERSEVGVVDRCSINIKYINMDNSVK